VPSCELWELKHPMPLTRPHADLHCGTNVLQDLCSGKSGTEQISGLCWQEISCSLGLVCCVEEEMEKDV